MSEEELEQCLTRLLIPEDYSVPWAQPGSPARTPAASASGAKRSRAKRGKNSQDLDLVNASLAELLEKLQGRLQGEQQANKKPSARFLAEDEIPELQNLLSLCEDFIRWQRFILDRNGGNPELQTPFCTFHHLPVQMRQALQEVKFEGFEEMPEIPQQRGFAKSCHFIFKMRTLVLEMGRASCIFEFPSLKQFNFGAPILRKIFLRIKRFPRNSNPFTAMDHGMFLLGPTIV